ncbi:pilin [Ectothiorhodospira shaposhnikovii]|nr:pilin [Ectothiorhodospira shaposhnikovii]
MAENIMTGRTDLCEGIDETDASTPNAALTCDAGVITVEMSNLGGGVSDFEITFTPDAAGRSWTCAVDDADNNPYVPANCRI